MPVWTHIGSRAVHQAPVLKACAINSRRAKVSIISELWTYLRARKKLWLVPIIAMMVVFGAILVLAQTSIAPFIYTIF